MKLWDRLWGKEVVEFEEFLVHTNAPDLNATYGFPSNYVVTSKYTILSFIPKNIFEQFRRYYNLYFLLQCIITLIPNVTPINPGSAIFPFLLIIFTAAVKEGYEDFKRHQADNEVNNRMYNIVLHGSITGVRHKNIRVGDIIYLLEDEEIPADLILLSSSNEGTCYVETANLDGETNLKLHRALPETSGFSTVGDIARLRTIVRCEAPNELLYSFKGNMIKPNIDMPDNMYDDKYLIPLNEDQLLMRGVTLRNTKWVYALVVYAGNSTKMALNQVAPPSKFSRTEKQINVVSLVVFCATMLLIIICTIGTTVKLKGGLSDHWYNLIPNPAWETGIVFLAYFVLFGFFIPISLFVNIELVKLIQGFFMMSDPDLKVGNKGLTVKNSNLNDELSRVKYIFSDKTGTLTQNKMVFDQCSIGKTSYENAGHGELKQSNNTKEVYEFCLNMALNHEVIPEDKGGDIPHFAAPTPDEIALVNGAWVNGIKIISRSAKEIQLNINNQRNASFELLEILKFESSRRRSSIVVKTPEGKIVMYAKGADSTIIPRLSHETKKSTIGFIEKQLRSYSKKGLRTLVFAKKEFTQKEYARFHQQYNSASASIEGRKILMDAVMDKWEVDLELQGCSAIQDKLQDKVPWTIGYLLRAGIKIWMITGDKQETAENIAKSCKLLPPKTKLSKVVKAKSKDECYVMLKYCESMLQETNNLSLVIDGDSLVFALEWHLDFLFEVSKRCQSVIVCRADPLQKALVVRMIKNGTKEVCLAVGDGANDVSMIQEADIGVGIWGKEGTQAARNSDFAIRMFKHIAKLITVHGRQNMMRTAILIEYSFYKNIMLFLIQFWFAFSNGFSGQSFFDDWLMAGYNTFILGLPPLFLAIFEKDLKERDIEKYPETYNELREGLYFTKSTFIRWMISAIYQSLVIYWSLGFYSEVVGGGGKVVGIWYYSTVAACIGVWVAVLRGALATRHWVWPTHLAFWGSILLLFILLIIESQLINFVPRFYRIMDRVFTSNVFWGLLFVDIVICLLPDFLYEYLGRWLFPHQWHVVQELGQKERKPVNLVELEDYIPEPELAEEYAIVNLDESQSQNQLRFRDYDRSGRESFASSSSSS